MDLAGPASQALETITDEQLSLMELAILTPEEWGSDYGISQTRKWLAAWRHSTTGWRIPTLTTPRQIIDVWRIWIAINSMGISGGKYW
eukprot:scaffold6784_cov107-Amphora_coffeaeformis.AAC.1